jgi:hypothetical protein
VGGIYGFTYFIGVYFLAEKLTYLVITGIKVHSSVFLSSELFSTFFLDDTDLVWSLLTTLFKLTLLLFEMTLLLSMLFSFFYLLFVTMLFFEISFIEGAKVDLDLFD